MTLKLSASCYHPTPWKESYLKIKFGVFIIIIFLPTSAVSWVTSDGT